MLLLLVVVFLSKRNNRKKNRKKFIAYVRNVRFECVIPRRLFDIFDFGWHTSRRAHSKTLPQTEKVQNNTKFHTLFAPSDFDFDFDIRHIELTKSMPTHFDFSFD